MFTISEGVSSSLSCLAAGRRDRPKHFNSYGSEPFGMGEGDTVSTSQENLIFTVLAFELKAIILIHVVIYLDKTKNSISSFAVEEA